MHVAQNEIMYQFWSNLFLRQYIGPEDWFVTLQYKLVCYKIVSYSYTRPGRWRSRMQQACTNPFVPGSTSDARHALVRLATCKYRRCMACARLTHPTLELTRTPVVLGMSRLCVHRQTLGNLTIFTARGADVLWRYPQISFVIFSLFNV